VQTVLITGQRRDISELDALIASRQLKLSGQIYLQPVSLSWKAIELGVEAMQARGHRRRLPGGVRVGLNQFTIDRPFLLIILIPKFPEKIVYIAVFSCYNVL
jgi:hypothetical protein